MGESKIYNYEYVPQLIGMKTNIKGFRWGFGQCDSSVSQETFDQCKIKIFLTEKADRNVFDDIDLGKYSNHFRHFRASTDKASVIFDQKIGSAMHLRYVITVDNNTVRVVVGKSYMRFVKAKLMYVHSMAYILFDIVSLLLLKNGMTTLYCSSVYLSNGKTIVFMAPPNTGKSLCALKMKRDYDAQIIAEDMAVTDGTRIFGAPHTNLYRNYKDKSLLKLNENSTRLLSESIEVVAVLQKGNRQYIKNLEEFSDRLLLINRYSLGYTYSPFIRVLNYFNEAFSVQAAEITEKSILKRLQSQALCVVVENSNPMQFSEQIQSITG